MSKIIISAALAIGLATVSPAPAQQPIEVDGALPQAQVSYSDLNLATPTGRATLQGRVRSAARRLCLGYAGGDIEERIARQTCFDAALASARGQVDQAVAEFGRTDFAGRRPITVAAR